MTKTERPTIPDVIDRFSAYHRENPTWGVLHVVLEDGNVSDEECYWCYVSAVEKGDAEGAALAKILQSLSKTQRKQLGLRVL